MPSERTTVTELATALGMLGADTVADAVREQPAALAGLGDDDWAQLQALERDHAYAGDFYAGFANGRAFLRADDALAGGSPASSSGPAAADHRATRWSRPTCGSTTST